MANHLITNALLRPHGTNNPYNTLLGESAIYNNNASVSMYNAQGAKALSSASPCLSCPEIGALGRHLLAFYVGFVCLFLWISELIHVFPFSIENSVPVTNFTWVLQGSAGELNEKKMTLKYINNCWLGVEEIVTLILPLRLTNPTLSRLPKPHQVNFLYVKIYLANKIILTLNNLAILYHQLNTSCPP